MTSKKTKFLSLLLCCVMLLSLMPISALADDTAAAAPTEIPLDKLSIQGGVIKGIDKDWFSEHSNDDLKLVIPDKIDGTPITGISASAFKGMNSADKFGKNLVAVDFSNAVNLETIGNGAFMYCKKLTSVDLSSTKISVLSKQVFSECTSLTEVILPDTLTSLGTSDGASVFANCKSLKSIRTEFSPEGTVFELPSNLTYIGTQTFKNCFAPEVEARVIIPASVTSIGSEAFYDNQITQIVIKLSVDGFKTTYSDYYAPDAFQYSNGCDRLIVLNDNKCYVSFTTNVSGNIKDAAAYRAVITFNAKNAPIKETHLNHALLGWQLNEDTGFWDFNESYKLPESGCSQPADKPGYEYAGAWKLNGCDITLKKNVKLDIDQNNPSYTASPVSSSDLKLKNPEIKFTVDGNVISDYESKDDYPLLNVTIGDGESHCAGVNASHELLLSNNGSEDGEYVFFEYAWWDENRTDGVNGPRSIAEPELFSTAADDNSLNRKIVNNASIPIVETGHARYDDGQMYMVEIFGYIVRNGSEPQLFYKSHENFIHFGSDNDGAATVNTSYAFKVKVNEVRVISASAGKNGTISPDGRVSVPLGGNQTFTITPDKGYHISDVKVDGKSVGAVGEYTFENVNDAHTIEATFARNIYISYYTLSYESNGGTQYPNEVYRAGTTVTLDKAPTRDGYVFTGWFADKELTTPVSSIVMIGNKTVYAGWDVERYVLSYESNGGTKYDDETYEAGTVVTIDKAPTRDGYVFTGWFADEALTQKISSVKMTSDKTVYAGWEQSFIPPDLNSGDHIAYIHGYPDGRVGPKDNLTRAQMAMMLYNLLTDTRKAEIYSKTNSFTDVSSSAWYNEAVSTLANGKYILGYVDGSFGPENDITRAEFVAMLVRFIGVQDADCSFPDVTKDHWAYAYISTATTAKWIVGYEDGRFGPNDLITRAEAATILNRVLDRGVDKDSELLSFRVWPDNSEKDWFYYEIIEATNDHEYTGSRPSENWTKIG